MRQGVYSSITVASCTSGGARCVCVCHRSMPHTADYARYVHLYPSGQVPLGGARCVCLCHNSMPHTADYVRYVHLYPHDLSQKHASHCRLCKVCTPLSQWPLQQGIPVASPARHPSGLSNKACLISLMQQGIFPPESTFSADSLMLCIRRH